MTAIQEFKQNLMAMKEKFEPLLKSDTDKFLQIAQNYVEQNQGLLDKDRLSLYASIMRAAQQGLYIDGQESALIPFKGQVKFMSMYKGLLKQVRNSGELASINCGVVYDGDTFEYFVDENGEHIKHVPQFVGRSTTTKHVGAYAIARIKENHPPYIEVMTEEEIQNCKKSSRAGDDSPWNGLFSDEMRKKTVLRRISKRLPSSTDLNATLHEDDELFNPPAEPETPPPAPPETSARLRDAVTPQAVAPASAPVSAPSPVTEPKQTGEMVEGIIEETKTFNVQKDGKPATLYQCKIAGVAYLTFSPEVFKTMNAAKDKKSKVTVFFQKAVSASNKAYNNVLEVRENVVAEEEVPI